mmetsp:Transcript_49967/g.107074  ORF Transcript_49967/g.107074 Transcript_49967/m.107074 type:complete len:364 (+) Transcript_49967:114-1205(+)
MVAARCVLSLWILLVTVNMSQALHLIHASKVLPESKFSSVGEDHQPGATAPYSLCKDGKLLPQLYLLGAAKSGTTTIATYLLQNGILTQAYPDIEKEWHFFDWRYYGVQNVTPQFLEGLRHDWMYELPPCTPADEPRMIGDYTPDNLRLVPLPEGSSGGFSQPTHADLPLTLQYFYGEELYPKLTFMVMMRDPLDRFQSSWYFFRERHKHVETIDPEATFDRHVREVLHDANNSHYRLRLWQSMYGSQLKSWLERFEARQFIFAPMMIALNGITSTFSSLSKQLGIPLNETHTHLHENSSPHPSVSEDCSPGTIAMFDHFMEDDHRLLLEELAKASLEGASLVGYTGSLGNKSDIDAWLLSGM